MLRTLFRRRLRARPLPQVEAIASYAWSEGLWTGVALGFVIGLGAAVVALKG